LPWLHLQHIERTRGLEDGVDRALRAVEAAEVPVVISGDGLLGGDEGMDGNQRRATGQGGRGRDRERKYQAFHCS